MRLRALTALTLFVALLAAPQLASAQSQFSLSGFIVSTQSSQSTFVLQDVRGGTPAGAHWTVRLIPTTETRAANGAVVRGTQAFNYLQNGAFVDVQGWTIGGNLMFATAILVRAYGGGGDRSGSIDRVPGWDGRGDDDDDDDDRRISVAGVITNLDSRGQGTVQLREQTYYGAGVRTWTVRLHPQTRVEGLTQDRGQVGRGNRAALRLLRVGDFIEVLGRMDGRQIRAQLIRVRAPAGAQYPGPNPNPYPPYPNPYPPYPNPYPSPNPYPAQTVIIAPTQGSEITGSEFSVVGQTMPGAQVRVQVTGRFGVFNVPVANGTVTANQNGYFTFTVRPSGRVPGTIYTITVTASAQGYNAPPVTVTVRQQ